MRYPVKHIIASLTLLFLGNIGLLTAQEPSSSEAYHGTSRIIEVNMSSPTTSLSDQPLICVGAGRAHEGLMANWQQQLTEIQKHCAFKYIRFHGLLHDDMGVFKMFNGHPQYNFQYIDALYDFLLSVNIRPFVELSFMPHDLRSGDETVFWWKGNATPPSDYAQYKTLIKKLVTHLTERYGREEVKEWYFEVWNEPNYPAFFTGDIKDYFHMYQIAAEAIKEVDANYRVGGPATSGCGWVPQMIEFADSHHVALDFISTHTYGVEGALDEYGTMANFLRPDPMCIVNDIKEVRRQMKEANKGDMELHITEFNTSYSPRDPIHDTYQNATYLLNVMRYTPAFATSMSYWTFTDIFEEAGTVDKPFHGGFGLINWQDIRKPSFYAYAFYNQLYSKEIETKDTQSWITTDGEGNLSMLIYDFTMPQQGKESNPVYFTQLHPAKHKGQVNLEINQLQDGQYILECQQVGYKQHDPQSMYLEMGKPDQLTLAQEKRLRQDAISVPTKTRIDVHKGSTTIKLDWLTNQFYLVRLIKVITQKK